MEAKTVGTAMEAKTATVTGMRVKAATSAVTGKRLYFLDNLRVALITLVIVHHVGQAYGPTGGFWPIQQAARWPLLGPFFTVNRSFFMSLFFMISGYLMVMSYNAKGPVAGLKSRLLRLGLPVLFWGLLMIPLQVFAFHAPAWPIDVGHMWFVEHLLLFSAVYAVYRMIRPARPSVAQQPVRVPGPLAIILFALGVALASSIIRTWYDIDQWTIFLGFFKVEFADVPRDLAFFIIGAVAYRQQWITRFSPRAGLAWLGVGVTLAALWYAYDQYLWRYFRPGDFAMGLIYPTWEALLCCGLCIGLTVLFRERLNVQSRLSKALAQSQYTAYIIHVPLVLLVQGLLVSAHLSPAIKFGLVTLVAVPLVFMVSNWLRKPLHL